MARIPDAFIDDLLARADIVELIGARVPLKRQGKEYSARCPFHDERSPSFTVSPTKQFYHCFGCGAHGTAISFLMNYDRLEFLDAVEELARQVGVEVPRDTQQRNANPDSHELFETMDAASGFYVQQLAASDKARAYLDGRAVDADIRAKFAIGYAPGGFNALRDALGTDPRRLTLLERGGMLSKNESGRVYDKFRDRVMFPIIDRRGRTIGFGGRVLGKDDGPKYLNSPETELFHKGRELYGLWQVRQAHKAIPRLVVVEGYMDVVALFQHGVDTAVATLGTATTADHAELLFRNAPEVYFCFDGDRAGRGAALKAMESVLPRMKDGRQAFFLFLPDGEDPDSIVRKEGRTGFNERLSGAIPLSEFYLDERTRGISLTSFSGKAALADRCRADIKSMPDGGLQDALALRLKDLTGTDVRAAPEAPRPATHASATTPRRSLVRSAISALLQQPAFALALEPPFKFAALRQPGIALFLDLLQLVHARPDINTGLLLEHFEGREEHAALKKLAAYSVPGEEAIWRQEFLDAVTQLNRMVLQQRLEELQAKQHDSRLDEADKVELRALLLSRFA